jgi:hypothetical protein
MGSRLAVPAAGRTWDPDGWGLRGATEWIPFTPAQQRVNWATVLWGFYGKLLGLRETTFNSDLEHPVFACGYDWRSSNAESGVAFAAFIGKVLSGFSGKAKDVIVITHSMGGLVVRAALASAGSLDAQIRGVIHGAQPSNGAVLMYRRFFTGANPSLDGWGRDWALGRIMGSDPATFAYNLSGASGPIQLLPNDDFAKDYPRLAQRSRRFGGSHGRFRGLWAIQVARADRPDRPGSESAREPVRDLRKHDRR